MTAARSARDTGLDLDEAVRTLDNARDLDTRTNARAIADLERILSTAPSDVTAALRPADDVRPAVRAGSSSVRRVVLAGGLVAAATTGVLVLTTVTGEPAYASWTASPTGLNAEETVDAAQGCRELHARTDDLEGANPFPQVAAADVAVAERRGDWTMVVLTGDGDLFAHCITPDLAGGFGQDGEWAAGASTGDLLPGARELTMKSIGTSTMEEGPVSVVAGLAGSDVTDVIYLSRTHGEVAATVSGGAYALWFPGDELDGPQLQSVDVQVRYRDGTTETKTLAIRDTA